VITGAVEWQGVKPVEPVEIDPAVSAFPEQ
jgi:hypothetical protein